MEVPADTTGPSVECSILSRKGNELQWPDLNLQPNFLRVQDCYWIWSFDWSHYRIWGQLHIQIQGSSEFGGGRNWGFGRGISLIPELNRRPL